MRIKLDENIPVTLAPLLAELGHDADTATDEGLTGCDDNTLWRTTQAGTRFLVTQDLDFSDLRKFVPGDHCGILLVRLQHSSRRALLKRIAAIFATEDVNTWPGCFVVATDHKIPVRRTG
jgi:predicted nuclease of predicted toxin-antitoxin system